ncbi:MAG: extracellular solute-binding protein [Clostridia bacterium]|nr:extracellular solute-binding protein [Clostridia bacterium]
MKKYRLTALLLALCAVLLPSCTRSTVKDKADGNGEQIAASAEKEKPQLLTHIFRSSAIALPEGYRLNESVPPQFNKDENSITCLCSVTAEMPDPADPERVQYVRENHILTVSADGTVIRDLLFQPDALENENAGMQGGVFTDDSFLCLACAYDPDRDVETYYLVKYSFSDGSTVVSDSLQPLFAETDNARPWFSINAVAADKDGCIYLNSESEILVLDANFVKSFSVFAESWINGLTASPDGTVYASGRFDGETGLCPIDKSTKSFGQKLEGINSLDAFYFGGGYDIYFTDDAGLYGLNFAAEGEESTPETVMNYQNSDVSELDILCVIDETTLLAAERDPETFDTIFSLYKKADDVDLSSVKVIELAANGLGYTLPAQIVAFNKANPDCRIVVTDYSTLADYQEANQKLSLDVINGTIRPDLIIASPDSDLPALIRQNVLYTDLYPYIDRDADCSREDIFGAVRRMYDDNGKLYALTNEFSVRTLLAPDSILGGRTSWTFSELLTFAESLPADTELLIDMTQQTAAGILFGAGGYGAFIDMKTGEAHFDSEDFIRYLEFLASLPADIDYDALPDDYRETRYERRLNGKAALETKDIREVYDWLQMQVLFGTEDYTLIGYPVSAEGFGSFAQPGDTYIITSYADYPAEAWEFVKSIAMPAYDENRGRFMGVYSFPILKSLYDKVTEECFSYQYRFRLDGTGGGSSTYNPERPRTQADYDYPVVFDFFTAEDQAALRDYLDNKVGADSSALISDEITAIVNEEISSFLAGMRNAQAAADMIQSRVSLWLAEHE